MPHAQPDLEKWRSNFTGSRFEHQSGGFLVYGAVDDLWQSSQGELIVVDYRATSKAADITDLNEDWHRGHERQRVNAMSRGCIRIESPGAVATEKVRHYPDRDLPH